MMFLLKAHNGIICMFFLLSDYESIDFWGKFVRNKVWYKERNLLNLKKLYTSISMNYMIKTHVPLSGTSPMLTFFPFH